MSQFTKAVLSLVLLVGTLVVNALGAFGFFNGMSQKAVSDLNPTLITPAPFTFGIWSVIYLLLLSAAVLMVVKNKDPLYSEAIDQTARLFWVSSGLNMLWIVCFSYNFIGMSAIIILAFAIVLALLVKRLSQLEAGKSWLLPTAFGLYSGWLLIATVVNFSAFLVSIGWNGFGLAPEYWASIVLVIAVGLAFVVASNTKNFVIPLPIAWGFFGIYQAHKEMGGGYPLLQTVTLIGILLLLGISGYQFWRNKKSVG
ncbi:tryptophan-rich sensory protein [Eubacteriaceae bacterium ES3]|nr:tryptophan-rich sensory protein [Eubacteriaceae bacterium ES3]